MKNILIINAHHPYPGVSEGKLNAALVDKAKEVLSAQGYDIRITESAKEYDVQQELDNHMWADAVLLQTPVNWMGVSWSFKKYMDEVYSSGMEGQLCNFDGRSRSHPKGAKANYGGGGTLNGTKYMMSLTFNAPEAAFNDPDEYLFQGKSVDDLFFPQHMNFRFFAMEPLPTFVCYDVMKDPHIEDDFKRFETHLKEHFPSTKESQSAA